MRFLLRHERKIAWLLFPGLLVLAYVLGNIQQRILTVTTIVREVSAPPPETAKTIGDEMWWRYQSGVEMLKAPTEDVAPKWREEAFQLSRKAIPLPEPKDPLLGIPSP